MRINGSHLSGMKSHPRKHELMDYAENLVDNRAAISARMAAHIAACPACLAEVEAIRTSLEFARNAPEIEPSNDLTAQILIAARDARRAGGRVRRPAFCMALPFIGRSGCGACAAAAHSSANGARRKRPS